MAKIMMSIRRKTFIAFCISFVGFLIIVGYFSYKYTFEAKLCNPPHFEKLREKINAELRINDINNDKKSLLLDNICALKNKTGICYFNTVMQALFADRYFAYFFMNNKFCDKQPICIELQKVIYKLLTNTTVSLEAELLKLNQHKYLNGYFNLNGGDPSLILHKLIKELNKEVSKVNVKGSPENFYITEKIHFICEKCHMMNENFCKYIQFNFDFTDSLEKGLSNKFKEKQHINKNYKEFECGKCKEYDKRNVDQKIYLPNYFIVHNGRIFIKNKEIEMKKGKMKYSDSIALRNKKYELYSVILSEGTLKSLHVNCIAKKGDKWYLLNDEKITKVNLHQNSMIETNGWIYFYRIKQ